MNQRARQEQMPVEAAKSLPLHAVPPSPPQIEKFSAAELNNLRTELLRGQLDSWQAADVAANFLAGHGYGASSENLRQAITAIERSRCSIDCLQAALEGVAYIQ